MEYWLRAGADASARPAISRFTAPAALEPIGEFEVAGFSAPQTVFGLRESETVAIALR